MKLIEIMKNRFISLGGVIFEGYSLSSICIYDDAAVSFQHSILLLSLYFDLLHAGLIYLSFF